LAHQEFECLVGVANTLIAPKELRDNDCERSLTDLIRAVWPFMWAELVVLFLKVLSPALVTVPAKWFGG
jgi:hypothetical protein